MYQRVLGTEFDRLSPGLRAYFSLPPGGMVGRGTGVYEVAGNRYRWLRPVLGFLAWRRILFPEYGRGIPFDVANTARPDGTLGALRQFHFPGRERVMIDSMRVVDGHLHDFLGRRGGLECRLCLAVTAEGSLRLHSERLWLHLGPLRIPLPRVATVRLEERTEDDHQHVRVSLASPVLGEWFVYSGSFRYRYEAA